MNEFCRLHRLDSLSGEPRSVGIEADPAEREALARRFGLVALGSLSAEARLSRAGERATAEGRLRARVTQSCAASGDPVDAELDEPFQVDFQPVPAGGLPEEEIELGAGELDTIFYEGAAVDLGEAVAQSLALALDPFPRSPAAEAALRDAGVRSEEEARAEASPFAALKGLKDKLGK